MKKKVPFLVAYSIAMGYVEAMVVVYLRRLVPVELWKKVKTYQQLCRLIETSGIRWSEQTREFATIVMLVSVACLFGKNMKEKFAAFLISFGIWDIFYYIFLYIWLRWPENLLTYDVLFLIPSAWVAPVIIPVSISILMITSGFFPLINSSRKERGENIM